MRRALCSKGLLFFIGTNLAPRSSFTAPFFLPSFVSPVCTALQDDACRAPLGARGVRAMATSTHPSSWGNISLLTQEEAKAVDEELMSTPGFSVDQLMELAGLSVAQAVHEYLAGGPLAPSPGGSILVVCGPGNNGGDGLVAARHLHHFGYSPSVVYPKRTSKQLYVNLVKQCEDLGIQVIETMPEEMDGRFVAVVDAMLGFGATGPLRPPFDHMIGKLAASQSRTPVISVDIPSGWDVEEGDVHATGFHPAALVSLTAPKRCARLYKGRHFLGGRFVPPQISQRYKLQLLPYPGSTQVVEIKGWGGEGSGQSGTEGSYVVVWITAPTVEEARSLSDGLIAQELAACVNLMPGIESVYKWEGKVERSPEVLMMAKTRSSLLPELTAYIKSHHSYTVPETIAAAIVGGSPAYLQWLQESTKAPAAGQQGASGGKPA